MNYGRGITTYRTLPTGYSGNAYHYNGRYYSGGRFESGNYSYLGRHYSNRYYHNGQYLYGGNHQHYQGSTRPRFGHSQSLNRPGVYRRSSSSPYQLRHPSFGRRL